MTVWRYSEHGNRKHAMHQHDGQPTDIAQCGKGTARPTKWLGDNSNAERARLAALPKCDSCRRSGWLDT